MAGKTGGSSSSGRKNGRRQQQWQEKRETAAAVAGKTGGGSGMKNRRRQWQWPKEEAAEEAAETHKKIKPTLPNIHIKSVRSKEFVNVDCPFIVITFTLLSAPQRDIKSVIIVPPSDLI